MGGRKAGSGKSGKANIFDVAKLAGVSIKTVSRVVNDEPNVQDKTRAKVLKAVAQLGYKPNASARSLSGNKSYVIGLVYENAREFSYMKNMLNGAINACEAVGYTLLLRPLTLPDPAAVDRIREFATSTGMDGIILPPPICDFPGIEKVLADANVETVLIAPKHDAPPTMTILCNDEEASYEITNYVISLGHERIGFIKGHPDHSASDQRYDGYRRAIREQGISFDRSLVRQGYFDFESGRKGARKLLELKDAPTAIIASNDDMAAGVLFEAHERNVTIPDDLSVVGFDNTPIAEHTWPPLTTVSQPIDEMADKATRLLASALREPDAREVPETFACELVIRASTGTGKTR